METIIKISAEELIEYFMENNKGSNVVKIEWGDPDATPDKPEEETFLITYDN